ncbi:MAG: DUF3969 family protein [Eubacterium sp.]|nr:DUF3969 family protein [Eubacterium sp.]
MNKGKSEWSIDFVNLSFQRFNNVDEKIILISIIGTIDAIENDAMSIEEGEKFLFSPHTVNLLNNKNCSPEIVEMVELGCEMEDIKSLMPDKLSSELKNLKKRAYGLLKKYEEVDNEFWIQADDN